MTYFDLVDPDGAYLGVVEADHPMYTRVRSVMRGDTLTAVRRDDLDVSYELRLVLGEGG